MFKKWKTHFWSFFHLYQMKDILSKQFACLQNEKQAFEAFFVFTKWKHVFYLETLFISKKKERFKNMYGHVSVFYFVSVKNSSKMCFFLFCEFKNSLQNVLFYFCQNERRFKTFMILFAKTKNASKMCVSFLHMKYDSKAWSMKFLLK